MSEQWVEEKDWSKVNVGQRVRLEKENGDVVEFTVTDVPDASSLATESNWYSQDHGWTLYVTEPPTPELPTEPGHYQDLDGRHWLHQVHNGSAYGAPDRDTDQWLNPKGKIEKNPEAYGPFTRLAPVPDTARQVLDRLSEVSIKTTGGRDEDHRSIFNSSWDAVAAEFGVTEP